MRGNSDIIFAEFKKNVSTRIIFKEFIESHNIEMPQIAMNSDLSLKLQGSEDGAERYKDIPYVLLWV
jgi:hypothetical protein